MRGLEFIHDKEQEPTEHVRKLLYVFWLLGLMPSGVSVQKVCKARAEAEFLVVVVASTVAAGISRSNLARSCLLAELGNSGFFLPKSPCRKRKRASAQRFAASPTLNP